MKENKNIFENIELHHQFPDKLHENVGITFGNSLNNQLYFMDSNEFEIFIIQRLIENQFSSRNPAELSAFHIQREIVWSGIFGFMLNI